MSNTDSIQLEKCIQEWTEKIVEGRCDYDDQVNMLNTIVSLQADKLRAEDSKKAMIKLTHTMMEAR